MVSAPTTVVNRRGFQGRRKYIKALASKLRKASCSEPGRAALLHAVDRLLLQYVDQIQLARFRASRNESTRAAGNVEGPRIP